MMVKVGGSYIPFIFMIGIEGITGLMKKAVEIRKFRGFHVNEDVKFDILQFTEDKVILGEGIWRNLWNVKKVLRGFELISDLYVNFFKSKIYEINVKNNLMQVDSFILSCCVDRLPFKFLGV